MSLDFLALALIVANFAGGLPQVAGQEQPVIIVRASYPGANALVVAETVAAPVEQQVNGVPGALHLVSRSNNDGTYMLAVTFRSGVQVGDARMLVQKRVALALPMLPDLVTRRGITVKEKLPIRSFVTLTSSARKYDAAYLSDYVNLQIKDELVRLAGVGEIVGFGIPDRHFQILLDPTKLVDLGLTAGDVVKALQDQNVRIGPQAIGQPPAGKEVVPLDLIALGRLVGPEQLGDIVLKSPRVAGVVRLKHVARFERRAANTESSATLNGAPAMVLGVHTVADAHGKKVSMAIANRIALLRARIPEGLRLKVEFDFTANLEAPGGEEAANYLILDLEWPEATSRERMRATLARCDKILREIGGVHDVLTLSENPFDLVQNQPCILVRLAPKGKRKVGREELLRTIRAKVGSIQEATLRLRDLSRPGGFPQYPIHFAISGPEAPQIRVLAQLLVRRLVESKKLSDVWENRETTPRPFLSVEIDSKKVNSLGVAPADIFSAIGATGISDFNHFGRGWQVHVHPDADYRKSVEDLGKIRLRTKRGQMVPLAAVATFRESTTPVTVHRLNLLPMVEITANPKAGVSLEQSRRLCENMFETLRKEARLSADYRITWLHEIATPK